MLLNTVGIGAVEVASTRNKQNYQPRSQGVLTSYTDHEAE